MIFPGSQGRRPEGWPASIASGHVWCRHVQGMAFGAGRRDNVLQRAEVPRLQQRRLPVQCCNVPVQSPQGVLENIVVEEFILGTSMALRDMYCFL